MKIYISFILYTVVIALLRVIKVIGPQIIKLSNYQTISSHQTFCKTVQRNFWRTSWAANRDEDHYIIPPPPPPPHLKTNWNEQTHYSHLSNANIVPCKHSFISNVYLGKIGGRSSSKQVIQLEGLPLFASRRIISTYTRSWIILVLNWLSCAF